MKRFFAAILTVTMTLSLASPAFAAEGQFLVNGEPAPTIPAGADPADYLTLDVADLVDEPLDPAYIETSLAENEYSAFVDRFFDEYAQTHPEEVAAFDPHAYWQEDWGQYWDSEEEYIDHMVSEGYWDSAGEFTQEMWEQSLWEKADEAWYAQEIEAYRAAHPGELEALTQEQLLAWQGYTETLTPMEQYMKEWGFDDEEAAANNLLRDYVSGRDAVAENHAQALEYQTKYPEQWAGFDVDAFFREMYWEDKAEYMARGHLFTEEEFTEQMFIFYVDQNSWEWDHQGGWTDPDDWYYPDDTEPKPLTLMVNGEPVENSGVFAEYGVSYAPAATLNAAMGTNYISDGSALPIREAAEKAGWDVGWNEWSNTVFLLDGEGLKARYAESAAALDAVMGWALEHTEMKAGRSYKTTETLDVTLTMLDSLDGDKDYELRLTLDALQRDAVVEMKVTVNAADLLSLLGDDLVKALTAELPRFTARDLKALLSGVECSAILDLEKGNFYFNLPILAAFDPMGKPNTWYFLSAGTGADGALAAGLGMAPAELLQDLPGLLSETVYQSLLEGSADRWTTPADAFDEAEAAVAFMNAIAGPDTLKTSGSTLTWSVDAQAVNAVFSDLLDAEAAPFRTYEIEYVMKKDGSFTCDVAARPDMKGMAAAMYSEDSYYNSNLLSILSGRLMGLLDFQMEGHSAGTADKAEGTVEYHQKNAFKLKLDAQSERKEVKDIPANLPPKGAPVVEL